MEEQNEGQIIKNIVANIGLTNYELLEKTGLSKAMYYRIVNSTKVDPEKILLLSKKLGFEPMAYFPRIETYLQLKANRNVENYKVKYYALLETQLQTMQELDKYKTLYLELIEKQK
jgi:transcriptional regulator with XRE-family HTH domain